MPIYTFLHEPSDTEWDEMMSMAEREQYLKDNPEVRQVPTGFVVAGDHLMGFGPKQDNGMTENLQRIAEKNPGTPLADRYSPSASRSSKEIRTRQVLKKHGVI